jgi:phenylalanyl-tRNA synthetase beta chain
VKVVLSWLLELCPVELAAEELADRLTRQGVKVEAILRPWAGLGGVVVARVLEVRDHPGSDSLCLARVDFGSGERELVVGVRNMRPGDLVPLAGPGARVPAFDRPMEARSIRGVVSDGMLCSPRELGIAPDHTGILVLPDDAPVGADFKSLFGLDDSVLDVEVWSNRPDLMSVLGVAREASAATGVPLRQPDASLAEGVEKAGEAATVEVLDPERCPRYLARVIRGVTARASPIKVQARLTVSGMRPVSGAVDATNYVMLETGQPMHPFDLDRLAGGGVIVRRAEDGERLVTLDGVERTLATEDLVIADRDAAVGIAGVMGSAAAEVSSSTRNVLLESAHFERRGVLRTARRLDLQTEASIRFARGADPEAPDPAAARAAKLMAEWSGGTVLAGAIDVGAAPDRRRLVIRPVRASMVLAYPVSAGETVEVFGRLGITAEARAEGVVAEIPGYRPDLEQEVDLIEEVARVQGYDRVPETLPGIRQPGSVPDTWRGRTRIRRTLHRGGVREAISFSFAAAADIELMGHRLEEAVPVANPLAADDAYLRMSLVPGLVRTLARNVARGTPGTALFEVGHVFRLGLDGVEEPEFVAVVVGGPAGAGLFGERRPFDFLDAKGSLELLMEAFGLDGWSLGQAPGAPFHPGRSATVGVDGAIVGVLGELHPRVAERLDVPSRTSVLELDASALEARRRDALVYGEVPRYPPVHRDLAFTLDEGIPAGAALAAILEAGGELLDSVVLFDVFSGEPIPKGRKSLAFSLDFRAPDRTLTDQEVDERIRGIVAAVDSSLGGELRG